MKHKINGPHTRIDGTSVLADLVRLPPGHEPYWLDSATGSVRLMTTDEDGESGVIAAELFDDGRTRVFSDAPPKARRTLLRYRRRLERACAQ